MGKYDLIVIGAGPGGYPLALKMAKHGWKVALADRSKSELGGTCLNWGCIPTKALLASAKGYHFLKNCAQLGLKSDNPGFQWQQVLNRKNEIVQKLRLSIERMLQQGKVSFFEGKAVLKGGKRVEISGPANTIIEGDRICLATGSSPYLPAFVPNDKSMFWTSDEALDAPAVPESLLIVGAGVIGMELGQMFSEFGSKVTIVEMAPQILPGLDSQVSKRILPVFKKHGLEIILNARAEKIECIDGKVSANLGNQQRLFERALIATGRRTNLSFLDGSDQVLERNGNLIRTNPVFETSAAGIYAIGDATSGPMLAHKASYDASALASHWISGKCEVDYSLVPSCVFTYPEISWIGLSEDEAKASGIDYKVGRSLFSANGKAMTEGEVEGQIKTVFDANLNLLGAVVWGPHASDLIMEAAMMMALKCPAESFGKVVHPHPTLSETFHEAVQTIYDESVRS